MGKNYSVFNKVAGFVLAMAMAVGFTSCEDILGHWDSPAVKQAVETIVTITGADPAQVTAALKNVVTDEAVAAAIAKGEPIKVTIAGSGVSTEATDQTITIPQKNGAAIEINFATAPSGTDSNALVLQASEGAGSNPGDANNNLVVSMPASEGLAITIELPNTTVTLKTDGSGAVVYKDVIAKTATSTIIIDKGVTIKEHELVGGNIVVKDGGAIETLAITCKDNLGLVCLGSWWSGVSFKGEEPDYNITNEDGSPYVPKYLRIKKGKGEYVCIDTRGPIHEYVEKVTVDEGLTITGLAKEWGQYKNIEGKVNNRLHTRAGLDGEGKYFANFPTNTELVKNFTIANEIHDVESYQGVANLVINFVDSETSSKTFTFENCTFENGNTQFVLAANKYTTVAVTHYMALEEGIDPEDPDAWKHVYDYTDLQALLDEKGVPNKEVEGGKAGGYWIDKRFDEESLQGLDLTFTLIFKNCKIGENAISKDNVKFDKWGLWDKNNNGIKFNVKIDDTTYIASTYWSPNNDDPKIGTVELQDPTPPSPPAGD